MNTKIELQNELKEHIENHKNKVEYKSFNYTEPQTPNNELIPYLISRDYIINNFDLYDLLYMKGSEIPFQDLEDAYNSEWIIENKIILPEFFYKKSDGKKEITTLINTGRHRTIVLLRYLEYLPIYFNKTSTERYMSNYKPPSEWQLLNKSKIKLPDLPMKFLGESGRS
jgi:hypothetical protein